MKNKSRVVALLVGLGLASAACSDGLTDINVNPNGPTAVPVATLIPTSIQGAVNKAFGTGEMLQHSGIWAQHFAQIQYPDEETGNVRDSRMNGYWDGYYIGALKDIQTVIEIGAEDGHVNAQGVGMIWKSWIFHIITDFWGDIPYSQALNGEENVIPAYDAQADVYAGLLADLTAGAGMLSSAGQDFGGGDLIYGNDFTKWRKFANSMRMRLAMRMSEVNPGTAQSAFVAAYQAGGFTSNDDNAMLQWTGAPYENPFYENYLGRDDNSISMKMVETLKDLNDPRLPLYAEPAASDGEYRGHENGLDDVPAGVSLADISRIGNFWRRDGAATPSMIMTYSEVLFLQAEAAARGWIAGDAEALYMDAIEANMNQYDAQGAGPSNAEIADYLASAEVAYTGIDDIHLQKWIALFMNGSEAWANVRRVGVPDLPVGADLTWLGKIPVRFSYPSDEQSLNNASLQAALSAQGMSAPDLVTRVWWDPAG
ncbi:MAG: SusD/RagB family nutrient-binding outer membrane lipoprotein [Gemmatimonadetes bacterium]|nr:SusD/RagB family nutrient-binding outer membrane lipoprotein [Gemmatimonadota bacterium]NNM05029.1 SusD/RagB family nutrient-binding outer membrane lipoprotein [Gemmatimonadota bacterium]